MNRDREGRGRSRSGIFLVLLLVLLGFVAVRSRDGRLGGAEGSAYRVLEVPVEAVASAADRTRGFFVDLFRREHLRARVAELEKRLTESELENRALEDARRENERLEALLALKQQTPSALRAARVVGADASGAFRSVVIDLGTKDGVAKDAAVVSPDGLVGRVQKVGSTSAVVQLVEDASSGIGVIVERTRVQGVLVGSGRLECRLKYVPNVEDVREGDRVLASGLDGIYPRGVLVGRVMSARKGADAFLDLRVRPAVSLGRLETVLVFVRPQAGAPAAGSRDHLAEVLPPPTEGTIR